MLESKVIFIIPGFRQRVTNKAYKEISKILKSAGYSPILVAIPWKNSTISENTQVFLRKYQQITAEKKYILGFSYGAMIAFITSTKVDVDGLILCSLSPYFKEDVSKIKNKAVSTLAKQRYQDFLTLHCASLAKKTKARQILMLYGAEETKSLIRRVKDAFNEISKVDKHLIPVKQVEHDIGDRRYLNKIYEVSRFLN